MQSIGFFHFPRMVLLQFGDLGAAIFPHLRVHLGAVVTTFVIVLLSCVEEDPNISLGFFKPFLTFVKAIT